MLTASNQYSAEFVILVLYTPSYRSYFLGHITNQIVYLLDKEATVSTIKEFIIKKSCFSKLCVLENNEQ